MANDPEVSLPYLIKSQVYTIPSPRAEKELRLSLERLKPDIVHASLTLSPLDFRLPELCNEINVPLIGTFHPAFDTNNRNLTASTQQLTYQLYAPSLAKFNKIIVFSEPQKSVLEKLGVNKEKQVLYLMVSIKIYGSHLPKKIKNMMLLKENSEMEEFFYTWVESQMKKILRHFLNLGVTQ